MHNFDYHFMKLLYSCTFQEELYHRFYPRPTKKLSTDPDPKFTFSNETRSKSLPIFIIFRMSKLHIDSTHKISGSAQTKQRIPIPGKELF